MAFPKGRGDLMELQFCTLTKWMLVGAACACLGAAMDARAEDDLDLTCSGNSYKKDGPFPTPETFSLKIAGTNSVTIGPAGSDKQDAAKILANNEIQLKFKTGKFVGEYFRFTGDLFLIHPDSRLTRLTCKPS
ncbi:hypothetical protein CU048_13900 [Beijerinckiaceae bacterium]|nr:hypothetical protein CU048_13900 [Beijerinckiaceae bacterium]